MINHRTFSKSTLNHMNFNSKYGINWITFDQHDKNNMNNEFKLYATGDYALNSGRIYIALPTNKILTYSDKIKYNIIE